MTRSQDSELQLLEIKVNSHRMSTHPHSDQIVLLTMALNEQDPIAGNSRVAVPKSVGAKGDFGHFRSSKQHVDDYI